MKTIYIYKTLASNKCHIKVSPVQVKQLKLQNVLVPNVKDTNTQAGYLTYLAIFLPFYLKDKKLMVAM